MGAARFGGLRSACSCDARVNGCCAENAVGCGFFLSGASFFFVVNMDCSIENIDAILQVTASRVSKSAKDCANHRRTAVATDARTDRKDRIEFRRLRRPMMTRNLSTET